MKKKRKKSNSSKNECIDTNRLNIFVEKFRLSADKYYYLYMSIVLIVAVINLFYNLGNNPIRDWDEARQGVEAYEMLKNSNFILSTYNNIPDYYNLKPPMGIWLIAIAYKLFGFNAFALRLFSAVSAFFTIVVVSKFAKENINNLVSIISSLVLVTTYPFIVFHSSRTGDIDAQLVLFVTLGIYFILKFNQNIIYFYLSGMSFSMAFLLKSFSAFQLPLIIICYLLITKKYKEIKLKQYVMYVILSIVPIAIWIILRYQQDGFIFINKMISYDLLDRTSNALEGHVGGMLFYFNYLLSSYYWIYFLIIILIFYVISKNIKLKQILNSDIKIIVFLWIAIPLIIFTLAKTKLWWYINPIYPPLSLLIGLAFYYIINYKQSWNTLKIFFVVIFLFFFAISERNIVSYIKFMTYPQSQSVLLNLKDINNTKDKNIFSESWSQSDLFTAEVICELNPKLLKDDNEFLGLANQGDLLMSKNNLKTKQLTENNALSVVLQNSNYILLTKNDKN